MCPPVGWNSLLIELFWPKLCSNGSRKGWIRLWPAGLNWHFGAETDLFNFHSSSQFHESVYCFSGYRAASPFGSDLKILKTDWFWKQFASAHCFWISTQEPPARNFTKKRAVLEAETQWNWPRKKKYISSSFPFRLILGMVCALLRNSLLFIWI